MKLYRFSPIKNKKQLFEAIEYIHFYCHKLCKQSLGKFLPNNGNIGVFCHYDDEYALLTKIRQKITKSTDSFNQKYFQLHKSIVLPSKNGIPGATYTYLYIRKPDSYRSQVGDVDFYLEPKKYAQLKQSLLDGKVIKGVRLFERSDADMIELHDPDIDVLAYILPASKSEY